MLSSLLFGICPVLERPVSKMTYYVWSGTLNSTHSFSLHEFDCWWNQNYCRASENVLCYRLVCPNLLMEKCMALKGIIIFMDFVFLFFCYICHWTIILFWLILILIGDGIIVITSADYVYILNDIGILLQFLGRLRRVDLIISIIISDFDEICYVVRGRWVMHDGMPYDPIQGQGHETFKVRNSSIFKIYLLCHF